MKNKYKNIENNKLEINNEIDIDKNNEIEIDENNEMDIDKNNEMEIEDELKDYNITDHLFLVDDWQILDKNIEIDDKINLQLYILSDLNNNINNIINNTKNITNVLCKLIKNNVINTITDNDILKLLINPSLYISLASKINNISLVIINKFIIMHTTYSLILDKTINDNIVNYYYNQAFEIAYLQLINECINKCTPFIIKINTLKYKYNQSFIETIILNIENDMLLITIKNITYVFSKYYFLNNNVVQDKISNILCKIISNITVTFINGLLEGAYYILIERK